MAKILVLLNPFVFPKKNDEENGEDSMTRIIAEHIRKTVVLEKYYIRWKAICSSDVDVRKAYFTIASCLGDTSISYCIAKELWTKRPNDKEKFLEKISSNSEFGKIIGIVHYDETEIVAIFNELKIAYTKEVFQDTHFFVGRY